MDKPGIVITVKDIEEIRDANPDRIHIDPENVEKGLAKLVLTIIELIRKLMEKQAIKRVEGGSLSDEEIERVGETLMKLEEKMKELKEIFGLKDEDLNLNLGPLGDLM
ncbi:gas vesicle protein K [bacterium]|nr:gas vesicle protein K [bacterium]MBU1753285.1 gas vesicle protein K [bacterium]